MTTQAAVAPGRTLAGRLLHGDHRRSIVARLAVCGLVAIIATTAAPSPAGTVQITDFTTGSGGPTWAIGAFGTPTTWQWDQPTRTLLVAGTNISSDYLEGVYSGPFFDIVGGTALQLTGNWSPGVSGDPTASGDFSLELQNSGFLIASASFKYQDFLGGKTVSKALVWTNPPPSTHVTQWQLHGAGSPTDTLGDLELTNMLVVTGSNVPEIDPAGVGSVLALVTGALGLLERRRLKAA